MRTRDDIYVEGLPADEAYGLFVDFALEFGGETIVDLGCGYGAYARRLQDLSRRVTGLDSEPSYVARARERGVDAVEGDAAASPFADGEFETALLFEVLEHVDSPASVLAEALRIASRNVLVTLPNVDDFDLLAEHGLTYWHMLTTDHVNFLSSRDMIGLAAEARASITLIPTEPVEPFAFVAPRSFGDRVVQRLRRHGFIGPIAYRRLLCVLERQA